MKRINSIGSFESKFNEVFNSLKQLSRVELISVVNESNRLLAEECSKIVETIPEEVWFDIFFRSSVIESREPTISREPCEKIIAHREKVFRMLSCVSRSFQRFIRNFVPICFDGNFTRSDWILNHFLNEESVSLGVLHKIDTTLKMPNLKSLEIRPHTNFSDNILSQLTNLTKFSCPCTTPLISDASLVHLNNLTELDISCSKNFTDFSVQFLTNLQSLTAEHSQISDLSITALTNLTNLKVDFNQINFDSYSKLTYLKSLEIVRPMHEFISQTIKSLSFLTQLTSLSIDSNWIDDNCLICLSNLLSLHLRLLNSSNVTNKSIMTLTRLIQLNVIETDRLNYHGYSNLTNLTDLELFLRI